jgi:transposase
MTRPYSVAFKQKMVQRLTGKDAVSALRLSRETGVRQQNLSRWLEEARSLPLVASDNCTVREWAVEQKARVLAEGSKLTGEQLSAYLAREGVKSADFERWRVALEGDGQGFAATTKHIRKLERKRGAYIGGLARRRSRQGAACLLHCRSDRHPLLQRKRHGCALRDVGKTCTLFVVQLAFEAQHARYRALVAFPLEVHVDMHRLQRPLLALRVHSERNRRARAQRRAQQLKGRRPRVLAAQLSVLVSVELMMTGAD